MQPTVTPFLEADEYFSQMKKDRNAIEASFEFILNTIDTALQQQDYDTLLSLISYIEEGEGKLAFNYIGKTHRFLRILHIIALERKYNKQLFSNQCSTAAELIDKYMLTMFAFRRLLFQLSDISVTEAICYLKQYPISHLAAYSMTQDELIVPNQTFYENLAVIYGETEWSINDIREFFALIDTRTRRTTNE